MFDHEIQVPFDWRERSKWIDLPIPISEYQKRVQCLQQLMQKDNIAGILVYGGNSDKSNVQYASGFDCWNTKRGNTFIYIPNVGDGLVFVTDALYHGEPAHSNMHKHWIEDVRFVYNQSSPDKERLNLDGIAQTITTILKDQRLESARIGICNPIKIPHYLMSQLGQLLPRVEFVSCTSYFSGLRQIKSEAEILLFRKACRSADAALSSAFESLRLGISERELYSIMAKEAFNKGADVFRACVAFGPKTALKNDFTTSERKLLEGEIVSLDVLCGVAGYSTDTHRNAMIGKPANPLSVRLMDTALGAGMKVLEKIGPGAVIHDLQELMYEYVAKAGLSEYDYTKSLFAHGCGLDPVEAPFFFWGNKERLQTGMTFYLEPCLVKHDLGTACWESLILITENGYEVLNEAPDMNW